MVLRNVLGNSTEQTTAKAFHYCYELSGSLKEKKMSYSDTCVYTLGYNQETTQSADIPTAGLPDI